MKPRCFFLSLFAAFALKANAAEVIVDPGVVWYDTNAASVLSIWGTNTGCNPLRADPANGSRDQVLAWLFQLIKAQDIGLSVGVGYDASCNIIYIARMR